MKGMTSAQIKEHVKEWRQLGDILINRGGWDSIGVNGQKRKRKGKGKEKLPEKKKQKEEEEKRFFIFSNDFLSNIMQMPVELQYPILEQMLMPKFLDNSVDNSKRLPHAIMEIRKLDAIFKHFVTTKFRDVASTKNWIRVLLSPRIQIHMYTAWLQHPVSSFSVGNRTFHAEPFSEPEFKELRLVELIKMTRLAPHLWYRSFLSNVLFNWYITETTYHVFASQMKGLRANQEASILKNHWPGTIEVMEEGLWGIIYNQFAGVAMVNLLGTKKVSIPADLAHGGFRPKLTFLLGPWEKNVEHLPYAAISAAFISSLVSVLSYVSLIRVPSILWDKNDFQVLNNEPIEPITRATIGNIPWTPTISPAGKISPFVVFDPPVRAYDTAITTHGLMYSIGQMNLRMDQELHLSSLRVLSTYNTTRALSWFHATAGIRFRALELSSMYRMINDRPGPFIVIPTSLQEYNDLANRRYLIEPDPAEDHAPAASVAYVEKQRVYAGGIREEGYSSAEGIYQNVENFEDITETKGEIPSWLRLVLAKEPTTEAPEEDTISWSSADEEPEEEEAEAEEKDGGDDDDEEPSWLLEERAEQKKRDDRDREYARLRRADEQKKQEKKWRLKYGDPKRDEGMSSSTTTITGRIPKKLEKPRQVRMVQKMSATVTISRSFVAAKIEGNPIRILFGYALSYVSNHKLRWNIQWPRSWEDKMGPHVTLRPFAAKYEGEKIEVKLLNIEHFVIRKKYSSGYARWVVLNVTLPKKFKCPQICHISIGQEIYKPPTFWN